ncbi:VOC family protein [Agromyces rhizosphaerae]|uniref:VOC family protein n=1 Tax=Agromyces rhizosphaerae TaxID=88374 RepID=A0A9W6CVZ4_9MICO|nr:VOC family protein [Agromyces rhizosphaerae]GLI27799.1 VOC family protein [Agromyces rhizosphaerae]
MSILNPYLTFGGEAREAMEFYQKVFGGELTTNTFRDFHMEDLPEEELDGIMHAQLTTPAGFTLMGADAPAAMGGPTPNGNLSVSGGADEEDELRGYWAGLAEGGTIDMPLEVAPWGDAFGQVTDRYGVVWYVNLEGPGNLAG